MEKKLLCNTHGSSPWTGQVVCTACDAVWHLNVDSPPTADGLCTCGAKLVGDDGTARAICGGCYVERKSSSPPPRIDRTRCMGQLDPEDLGGPRCQAPATHGSMFGRRCDPCAEKLRQALRDPNSVINALVDGKACTEERIARLVRRLPS